jgi:hypothetical protein
MEKKMLNFNLLNGIDAKIKIKNILNKFLRIPLIYLLLIPILNNNISIQNNKYFFSLCFSIILIEERKNPIKPSL